MSKETSIAAYWPDGMNEDGLADWARRLRARLPAKAVSLGLVFLSPKFFPHAEQVLEILRLHAQIPLLAGCSGGGLVVNAEELESTGGLVLALYALPGATLKGVRLTQEQVAGADGENFWPGETGVARDKVNGWLAFLDPFQLDGERWLRSWNQNYSGVPVYGGLASGNHSEPRAQLYLDGEVFEDGGVAIAVGGDVTLAGVISQGCTPHRRGVDADARGTKPDPKHCQPARLRRALRDGAKPAAGRTAQGAGQPPHWPGRERIP